MPTLTTLRRLTADRLAPYELLVAGVGTGSSATGTAANPRRLVSTDLVSLDVSGTAPENPTDYLKDEWAYALLGTPEQRRIPEGAFVGYALASEVAVGYSGDGATEVGYLDVERPFSRVIPAGTEVEIHAIPPLRGGKQAGLHAHINKAGRVMLREDTILVPGTTGQYRYDVTALFPWLTSPAMFVSAHYVETRSGVDTWAIPGAAMRFDADALLLVPNSTIATGQSFPVRVLRPLATWIKTGGAWGESAVGLVDEDDECLGDADAISLVAAFHGAEAQADACVTGSPAQAYWLAKARAFAARSPFLKDQAARRPASAATWPDNISPLGRFGGRWGPGF